MVKYILKGKTPVKCSLQEWAKGFETEDRRVASSENDNISVSTVFLGLNHSFNSSEPPLLFETMIFGGEHDQYQDRYSTWDDAIAGHKKAVELAGI